MPRWDENSGVFLNNKGGGTQENYYSESAAVLSLGLETFL